MAPESSGAFFADILQKKKRSGRISGNHLILTAIENDSTLQIGWERLPD
jgi:hypothetical protein